MDREAMDGYIETLYDEGGGNPTAHYIKGSHEDLEDFVACLRDEWRINVDADYVRHCYLRFIPQRDGWFTTQALSSPARGATPRDVLRQGCAGARRVGSPACRGARSERGRRARWLSRNVRRVKN